MLIVVTCEFTVAVIIGVAAVTALLMSVDSHSPMAACSNSLNIRHGMDFFFLLKHTHKHTGRLFINQVTRGSGSLQTHKYGTWICTNVKRKSNYPTEKACWVGKLCSDVIFDSHTVWLWCVPAQLGIICFSQRQV